MKAIKDKKILFKAMQAIEGAFLILTNKKDAIRIDQREERERNLLSKFEFSSSIEELKKQNAVTIEQKPGGGEHPTQQHFQIHKTRKFMPLFRKLQNEYPNLQD